MDIETIRALAPVGTLVVGVSGLYLAWRTRRESQLRQADVLKWALEAIATLQRAVLAVDSICFEPETSDSQLNTVRDAAVTLSASAEQGRMFFKNKKTSLGKNKPPAYQGLRPEILDQLIIASKVCIRMKAADQNLRLRLRYLLICAEQNFVSLAQSEVGRSRAASSIAASSGTGSQVDYLLTQIPDERLQHSAQRFRR